MDVPCAGPSTPQVRDVPPPQPGSVGVGGDWEDSSSGSCMVSRAAVTGDQPAPQGCGDV